MRLSDLVAGEKLRLWRERMRLTHAQAGVRLGLTYHEYGQAEKGVAAPPVYAWRGPFEVLPHEECAVLRRRFQMTQKDVAKAMKRSRIWVCRMENGLEGCQTLVKFWEAKTSEQS